MTDILSKKKPVIVSISIVDDAAIRKLNKKHRGKDEPTDVLSFDINEDDGEGNYYLGDVVVNREQAARQAEEYENSVEKEVAELVEHGVLHLLGVHHDEDD